MTNATIATVATTNPAQILGLHVLRLGGKAMALQSTPDAPITLRIVARSVAAAQILYSKACKRAGWPSNITAGYEVRLANTQTVIAVVHHYSEGHPMPVLTAAEVAAIVEGRRA